MYAQRNPASDTLLTQAFHPSSAEDHFATQNFLEEQQQQQQQQYNQEQLDEIQEQLNSSNMVQRFQIAEANGFAFQTFDNNILGNSLPADWQQQLYTNDDMCGLVNDTNFSTNVFVDDLMSSNFVEEGSSWILDQNTEPSLQLNQQDEIQQVHTPLSNSSSDTDSEQNNESNISSDQNRAQTPGPLQKSNIPNYLTIRRRSLSADNIHALAKSQQLVNNRKMIYPIQQNSEQISFDRTSSSIPPAIRFEPQMQFLKQEACISQNVQIENQPNINNDNNDNDRNNNNNRRQNSRTSSPSPQTNHATRPHLSRSVSHQQIGPINHAQKLSELQARFKVKLDKRTQRSMPNIQLAAVAHGAMLQSNAQKTNQNGGSGGVPIMEISSSSLSTPSTPTFPNEKPLNVAKQTLNPPRRGHTRKRSLSAPTTPFPNLTHHIPGSVPLQPTQSFPLNFSMASYARRPNALPIQIQRNPKHSHATTIMSSEEYQRKLDEELEKVDFEDITVSELKEMLRQRGKPATGKKAVLMQRLQEEVEFVKAMKNSNNQLKSNNNSQFNQMISTPTSPSGVSLQSRIANLHISSPPMHSRRFSPYGSVSIPGSPRMMPSGLGNGRTGFNGNNVAYSEGDEWQFHNALMSHNIEEATVQSHSIMMMGQATTQQQQQQQHQSQEMFGQQQPSSAPATTTEFDQAFQQPPSSAPPMTTEFVEAYDFINPMNLMSIGPDMMRLSVSDTDEAQNVLLKQETDNENKVERQSNGSLLSNETVTGILTQQSLGFDFNSQHQLQDEQMMLKSDDFLNYTSVAPQHLPMQLELQQQDGMAFSSW